MQLFNEFRRRNVFRVAIGYIVSSWLLAQVADLVLDNIGAPDWVMQTILLVLALGFPVVVFFSWAYEVTPEGIKRESEIDRSQSITNVTGRKLDRAITVVLLIALAYFAFDKFVLSTGRDLTLVESTPQAVTEQAAIEQSDSTSADKSIAVLPFVNMSSDEEQEYFSDGITEEILNALAKVSDLKVAGRTSSFYFKNKNESFATIGSALGVENVLEGSVRKQGDKVRITAQLIRVKDGFHLWSETYDGDLRDVFALQEKIARAITGELKVLLQGTQASRLVRVATNNPLAHDLYLRAKELSYRSDEASLNQAVKLYNQAITEDSNYAAAWAGLASAYLFLADAYRAPIELLPSVRTAAEKAVALDPGLAEGHAFLGYFLNAYEHDFPAALRELLNAVALNPGSAESHFFLGMYWLSDQNLETTRVELETAKELDPLNPWIPYLEVWAATANGDYAESLKSAQRVLELDPGFSYFSDPLVFVYAAFGRWRDCIDRDAAVQSGVGSEPNYVTAVCYAHSGDITRARTMLTQIEAAAQSRYVDHVHIAEVHAALGDQDAAFAALDQAYSKLSAALLNVWFLPEFKPLRDDPRYLALMDKIHASQKPGAIRNSEEGTLEEKQ